MNKIFSLVLAAILGLGCKTIQNNTSENKAAKIGRFKFERFRSIKNPNLALANVLDDVFDHKPKIKVPAHAQLDYLTDLLLRLPYHPVQVKPLRYASRGVGQLVIAVQFNNEPALLKVNWGLEPYKEKRDFDLPQLHREKQWSWPRMVELDAPLPRVIRSAGIEVEYIIQPICQAIPDRSKRGLITAAENGFLKAIPPACAKTLHRNEGDGHILAHDNNYLYKQICYYDRNWYLLDTNSIECNI